MFVTCGSRREALRIGRALVEQRLAACVNILQSRVDSIYRWKGKMETAREVLLIIKTSQSRFESVRRAVDRLHSYDVPEIIALPMVKGSAPYLRWISESVKP